MCKKKAADVPPRPPLSPEIAFAYSDSRKFTALEPDVKSEHGIPSGSDWYDDGEMGTFGIIVPRDPAGFGIKQIFYGWDGSFSTTGMTGAVLMNGPKSVNAQWNEDYTTAYINLIIAAGVGGMGFLAYRMIKKPKKILPDLGTIWSK